MRAGRGEPDLEHDSEKHALGLDPTTGGSRFSEKIMLNQKVRPGLDSTQLKQALAPTICGATITSR
jgi:hypothetical protein